MYSYLDRRIPTLERGEYFLIWSIRSWVKAMAGRQCPPAALEAAFRRWGMGAALPHFHMAMMVLNREGLRRFAFAPLECGQLSDDEAPLLAIFAALTANAADGVGGTLALLVGKGAVGTLFLALSGVAVHLDQAGLSFSTSPIPHGGSNEP